MYEKYPAPPRSTAVEAAARIVGAGVVGAVAVMLALPAAAGALFGAWVVALLAAPAVAAVIVATLALLYRTTGGRGRGWRWAAVVGAGATLLAITSAVAWQVAGRPFGDPLFWVVAVGATFALCAAAGTRPTRPAAGVLVAAVAVLALVQVVPAIGDRLPSNPQRGCIASSAEEANANCP